jgi:hypothetical protein
MSFGYIQYWPEYIQFAVVVLIISGLAFGVTRLTNLLRSKWDK